MTMTKLNSAPPAVIIEHVMFTFTVRDGLAGTATAPNIDGYTFVCWVDFHNTTGYGVWKAANYMATTTNLWPQVPPSVTTVPSGKKIVCYALYMRNVGSMTYVAHG